MLFIVFVAWLRKKFRGSACSFCYGSGKIYGTWDTAGFVPAAYHCGICHGSGRSR